jgi:rhodanese-related sulfurtransferase
VDAEYVAKQIDGNQALIIDSRPKKAKYDKAHIPTAMSIPDAKFEALQGKLPRDLDTLLVFYCGGYT